MTRAPVARPPRLPRPFRRLAGRRARLLQRATLLAGVLAGAGWLATHGVPGLRWHDVVGALLSVHLWQLLVLAAVWLGGLGIYAFVLAAALPGLGVRRGLVMNLGGSAVANVLPLGGAVATALNWRMARGWGHSSAAFAAYCVVTNALDVVSKLLLPVASVSLLLALSRDVPRLLWLSAAGAAVVLTLGAAAVVAWRIRVRDPAGTGRLATLQQRIRQGEARVVELVRRGWARMLSANAAYVAAQVLLFALSLRFVGVAPSLAVLLAGAAIERLCTLVPVTPGGVGLAEVATVGWLVANGLDPAPVVAGVLLYRVLLVVMEIPVGGVVLSCWACCRWASGDHRRAVATG